MFTPRRVLAFNNFDPDAHSAAHALGDTGESLTIQSQREEADINVILRRFGVTGQLPQVRMPPTFGDFSGVGDYQDAQNLLLEAKASFNQLDPAIRVKMFDNDPGKFVAFCSDPANLPEMRKLGLAVPEKVDPPPQKVEIVNKAPEGAAPAAGAAAAGAIPK